MKAFCIYPLIHLLGAGFLLAFMALPLIASAAQNAASSGDGQGTATPVRIVTGTDIGMAMGTGFYVRSNIIATNFHVIDGANTIGFATNQKAIIVNKIMAYDQTTDLALLYTDIPGTPFPLSIDNLSTGMRLTAKGFPGSKDGSLVSSEGIFVGWETINGVQHLQFNGVIMPGMSGGPIVDSMNRVVGVNRLGNEAEIYTLRAGIGVLHLIDLLDQALILPYDQYMDVEDFFKLTRSRLRTEVSNGTIVITDH